MENRYERQLADYATSVNDAPDPVINCPFFFNSKLAFSKHDFLRGAKRRSKSFESKL